MKQLTEYLHCAKCNTMKNDRILRSESGSSALQKCFVWPLWKQEQSFQTCSRLLLTSDPTSQHFIQTTHLQQTKSTTSGNLFITVEKWLNIPKDLCGLNHKCINQAPLGNS